ncbi:MAG: CopG family transcriptional regulator [Rubrivivax sp.]|nr:MAG: CopG family transcriptional regulator [Rubrivivax sp.]
MPATPTLSPRSSKPADEKLTINIGCVDLGQIDLLVQEGFYATRSDLIRTAIRNQIATHAEVVRQVITRKSIVLGIQQFSAADLARAQAAGEKLQIRVLGLAVIAPDVTPELALATIESLTVLGALHASPAVKTALVGRLL